MIKNERQYRITRAQLDRFRGVLEELRARPEDEGEALRRSFETGAIDAQVTELAAELDEYDGLKSGDAHVGPLESLEDLPALLIRSRIASGLTQRDLAERLGMKEQQLQRYESDDWGTANLSRLVAVANALGISIGDTVIAKAPDKVDPRGLRRQLEHAGLDNSFVAHRLTPTIDIEHNAGDQGLGVVLDLAARVNRIYGWSPSDVLAGEPLDVELPVAVGFKTPKGSSEPRHRAYTVYAHYLANLALDATTSLTPQVIPTPAAAFRAHVMERDGRVDFASVLTAVWDLGIPVVPLADPGGFHAVVFRRARRNVIVLKQQMRTPSRWVFDLLHEVEHAAEEPETDEYAVVDDDADPAEAAELAANGFAGDVLLDGRAEELTNECVQEAKGNIPFLKAAVPRVAKRNSVNTADLANYVAFRLSLQGENWWGTATNLQESGVDPWETARDVFLKRTDLLALNPLDRGLLVQALAE